MKKFSANYSNTNHNFVFQNLTGEDINSNIFPAICIIGNLLQRGKPTLMSSFLQEELGAIHKKENFSLGLPLIDNTTPKWERIIRGDDYGDYFPARIFYEVLIPKYLEDFKFIQQLLIPELSVNEITQVTVQKFKNQQVDFYLPQAYLVIEIDGSQHSEEVDRDRDLHFEKYNIKTVRITTEELRQENGSFLNKIDEIKNRIERAITSQSNRKLARTGFYSLSDYQKAYSMGIDTNLPEYKSTAIIRFQLLLVELLKRGTLDFSTPWKFEVRDNDITGYAELAIKDLFIWFSNLLQLHKVPFEEPKYSLKTIDEDQSFSNDQESIKIDFSLLKRYTDEFQKHPEVIYVRNDYLDEYRLFMKGDSSMNLKFNRFENYDYFKLSTAKQIQYKLRFGDGEKDEEALLFFTWNLFLQTYSNLNKNSLKFRDGQLSIIANALSGYDTIGLLPTGSGKSICYQLAAILQPAISFVVCPIKSLMYDQKVDLETSFFSRAAILTGDFNGEEKELIQRDFSQGKHFFIYVSPERFQNKDFRRYFKEVNHSFEIAYAVIDEAHCLSEWGHDFRISYLNLSETIKRLCTKCTFLGLTATASVNVLKDIQVEFGIKPENVKTPLNYTREELTFNVVDSTNDKKDVLKREISRLNSPKILSGNKQKDVECGVVFTPVVNGKNGCYEIGLLLSDCLQKDVRYYSGSQAKKHAIKAESFNNYKKAVQDGFKSDDLSIITATKAFGMGVNKGNIYYTIHYGIPSSMEALYQEAGRAGRDKSKFLDRPAECVVLLSQSDNEKVLSEIWDKSCSLEKLDKLMNKVKGDVQTNLFLFSKSLDYIPNEFQIIKKVHSSFTKKGVSGVRVNGSGMGYKAQVEKSLYRLKQLGLVEDWTVTSFFDSGVFEVDYKNFSEDTVKNCLVKTIRNYDKDFDFNSLQTNPKYSFYKKIYQEDDHGDVIDRCILILIHWSYDNFTYSRKQSLKNIYENCRDAANGKITKSEFKDRLEDYFKFSEPTYVLQHVVENPKDFNRWFDVFYRIESKIITGELINKRGFEQLRANLSRFLESYMNNIGLDIISGLTRLVLNDYDNSDGRVRFEVALTNLKSDQNYDSYNIIREIIKVGSFLNDDLKSMLEESIYSIFPEQDVLMELNKRLGGSFSLTILLENNANRLKAANKRIFDGFRKIK
ncbi:hypothetical protein LNTAR_15267 [Lentisphaera araneosa HTCC2155]|uniref:DNA 3'-5' helicase n=1 Tax=Lentisphaera araneosa HTCC2155 TaxID=313628 RepID=A6DRH8_9BACT|nr:RecQ family ATP-dependent DNA helicase [Lentisphaera araneosa]EDM25788.1 hypothetical protein LNTAR_15267 [Lentisphaera araneosa HTCC2155]